LRYRRLYITAIRIVLMVLAFCDVTTAKAQLSANFSVDTTQGCAPLFVRFSDKSAGSPTSWVWDLGNGNISTVKNPTAFYFQPGAYTIKLIVRNAAGVDSIVRSQLIKVYDKPAVAFTASDTMGCLPLFVQYTDQSLAGSGTLSSWQWDMGDGTISTAQNPAHLYTITGAFSITVKVKNSYGCTQIVSKPMYINVADGLHADFQVLNSQVCNPPSTVSFQNASTGPGTLVYAWSFGDGGVSSLPNPTHVYTTPGNYMVKLVVKNNLGCADSVVKQNAVTVTQIKASFTAPVSTCEGSTISILNNSTPSTLPAVWDFGDGTTSTDANPTKMYNVAGTYTIKLINGTPGCTDTISHNIVVNTTPSADFTSTLPPAGCRLPVSASFNNTSPNIATYAWDFGDGGTASIANPTHVYTTHGTFTVTLSVTATNGCKAQVTKPAHIVNIAPVVNFILGIPHQGCVPFTAELAANVSTPEPVASYLWDFGDNTTSSAAQPSHVYNAAGSYTVGVTITTINGCVATYNLPNAVALSVKPVAAFTASPLDACANQNIDFVNQTVSTTTAYSYTWMFGDGTSSASENPNHHYRDTGLFKVTLIVKNGACSDTLAIDSFVHISPPIADYNVSFTCDTPMLRHFQDLSIGATEWLWDFGDGSTSTQQHPSHIYATAGSYQVKLLVRNNTCTDEMEQNVTLTNNVVDFSYTDTALCHKSLVQFEASNPDPTITSYAWAFGDGGSNSSSTTAMNHVYTSGGLFNVILSTTDILGCIRTISHPINVTVLGPDALFSNPQGVCINTPATFLEASHLNVGSPVLSRIWDFGDGKKDTTTSSSTNHVYTSTGTFTVKLVVNDGDGCYDSLVKNQVIMVTDPQVDFTILDTLKCTLTDMRFLQNAQGYGLQYKWDFGDATSSTDANPVHQYATQGRYAIKLTVADQFGCIKSLTKTSALHVANPVAAFSLADSGSTCPPFIMQVHNTSSYATSSLWDFDDGGFSSLDTPSHFYNTPGLYNIKLTVTGHGNCSSEFIYRLNIRGPSGTISYSPLSLCLPGIAEFRTQVKNSHHFLWDFGDGNTLVSTDTILSHTYTDPGVYEPKLLLTDSSGCSIPVIGTGSIVVSDVTAAIDSVPPLYCDSTFIQFANASTAAFDSITSYHWNFGDGNTDTTANPRHLFVGQGIYKVKMMVTSEKGCTDTTTTTIKVVNSPTIAMLADTSICIDKTAHFAGQFVRQDTAIVQWLWTFGNNNQSTLQTPPDQQYLTAGTYVVSLLASNRSGCTDTVFSTLVVHPLPPVNAGPDTAICLGQTFQLSPTGAATYVWTANNTLSCTNCTSPIATAVLPMNTYMVTGTSTAGCISADTINIKVVQPFSITYNTTDTLCEGEQKQLLAAGAEFYSWTPVTGLNDPSIPNPIASPVITTNYMVIGRDYKSCFFDTGYVPIVVYPIPGFNIVSDQITIPAGTTITLNTTNSADINKWRWVPAAGLSCADCPNPVVTPTRDILYKAIAYNDGGCVKEDQVLITTICNGGNVFIPNTFSPNGDGMNDLFYPRGNGINGIKALRVFNRWGAIVFQKYNYAINDATAGWDGTMNGQKLPADVYIYDAEVICDNNQILPMKGNVTLIR
jgi:gliding motility-associated-like protein